MLLLATSYHTLHAQSHFNFITHDIRFLNIIPRQYRMTIRLVLLTLLIILLFLFHYTASIKEGFDSPPPIVLQQPLTPETVQAYTKFLNFYNPFCANWEKAIQTSTASEIPVVPATDPSQITGPSAPQISEAEMNAHIAKLSQQLNKPLPNLCQALPPQIDNTNIQQIIPLIPTSTEPYQNALDWMNTNLSQAHAGLSAALQGVSIKEGFEDSCQDITQCIANNPQLAQQLAQQISKQQQQQQQQSQAQIEQKLKSLTDPFTTNQQLTAAAASNQDLMQKSQDIQNQAQSGQLLNQINIPGVTGQPAKKYDIPAGGQALQQMQQQDPDRYNHLKDNYGPWFGLKQILEQINGTL